MEGSVKKNFFNVFGILPSFCINESELTKIYLDKQVSIHPDAVSFESEDTSSKAAHINLAYKVLMNPVSRAEHFLEVKGININPIYSKECVKEMYDIGEKYSSLLSEEEKKIFMTFLKKRELEIICSLHQLENNLLEFSDRFCLLRFINSFMKKVEVDVYSRN